MVGVQVGTAQNSLPSSNASGRPDRVVDLLYQGGVHPEWYAATRAQNRFYVLNLKYVMGELNIQHTTMKPFFEKAASEIQKETKWAEQYKFTYGCNHTHIYPDKYDLPKHFNTAVTIVFVMELYARDKNLDLNVYDHLRILPAQYFIDQFDRPRLTKLNAWYKALSSEAQRALLGTYIQDNEEAPPSFEHAANLVVGQIPDGGCVGQLAWGFCVTRFIADKLRAFINEHAPADCHVGPVLCSGQELVSKKLGFKNATSVLRVPKYRPIESLPAIPLKAAPHELNVELLNVKAREWTPVSDSIVGIDWAAAPMKTNGSTRAHDDDGSLAGGK